MRPATGPARKADRVVEAKHEVRRRKNKERSSTTSSKHDSEAKHIHDAEAKHYAVSAWRRDASHRRLHCKALAHTYLGMCVFFFPALPPVLLLVQMPPPLPPDVLFIARGAQSGAKRAIFSVAGLAAPPKASRRRHIECMQSESCSAWSSCEKGTAKGKGKDLLLQGREAEGEQRQGQTQQGN